MIYSTVCPNSISIWPASTLVFTALRLSPVLSLILLSRILSSFLSSRRDSTRSQVNRENGSYLRSKLALFMCPNCISTAHRFGSTTVRHETCSLQVYSYSVQSDGSAKPSSETKPSSRVESRQSGIASNIYKRVPVQNSVHFTSLLANVSYYWAFSCVEEIRF